MAILSDNIPGVHTGFLMRRDDADRARAVEKIGHNEEVKVLLEILLKKPTRIS